MPVRPVVWTTRLSTPGAGAFAVLFGFEAMSRALITAALPVQTLRLAGSDEAVSALYLAGSVAALCMAFVIPRLALAIGRARMCFVAFSSIALAMAFFIVHQLGAQAAGFVFRACGIAILYAGLSMFIMDRIRRQELGKSEPLRMLSIGISWTIGPVIGVWLDHVLGPWAPFAASLMMMICAAVYFQFLRIGEVPVISGPRGTVRRNPFRRVRDFLSQPRLRLSLVHAIGRGMFWSSFIFYTPIWAVSVGLGADMGAYIVAVGSAFLLVVPLWGWAARQWGIRRVSLAAFPVAAAGSLGAGLLPLSPIMAAVFLVIAALAMTVIDGYGNALFLRACKPSQRTQMTPIFSAQRDIAEISQAGLFTVLLIFFPVEAVFVTMGITMAGLALLSTNINARL